MHQMHENEAPLSICFCRNRKHPAMEEPRAPLSPLCYLCHVAGTPQELHHEEGKHPCFPSGLHIMWQKSSEVVILIHATQGVAERWYCSSVQGLFRGKPGQRCTGCRRGPLPSCTRTLPPPRCEEVSPDLGAEHFFPGDFSHGV